MHKRYLKFAASLVLISSIGLAVVLINPLNCSAGEVIGGSTKEDFNKQFKNVAKPSWGAADPTGPTSLTGMIGAIIQAFLGLLGVIFLAYLLYAGYSWMTAQGDEEKVTKAKDTIQRAIIGLIITIGAYAISYYVLEKLVFKGGILK